MERYTPEERIFSIAFLTILHAMFALMFIYCKHNCCTRNHTTDTWHINRNYFEDDYILVYCTP
jgi:hypothetical protein